MNKLTEYQIRAMNEADCESTFKLSKTIGWGMTFVDWKQSLVYAKHTAFVAVHFGSVVAVAQGFVFEGKVRVANVIVHPDHRRKGLGTLLVSHLVDHIKSLGHQHLELSASTLGLPIYKKLGFILGHEVMTWEKTLVLPQEQAKIKRLSKKSLEEIVKLDIQAFGHKRESLFESLADKTFVDITDGKVTGYLTLIAEEGGIRIGPWTHTNKEGAKKLFDQALSSIENLKFQNVIVTTNSNNPYVNDIVVGRGFHPAYISYQMTLGNGNPINPEIYYAISSLAEG